MEKLEKFISLVLKVINLGSKLFLLIVLAKYTNPETVASFGLYWSTLVLSSGMMGLEVYSHTARSIIQDTTHRNIQLRKHLGFLLIISCIVTPIISAIFGKLTTVTSLIILLFPLHLLFEFFSQEITRLLVPLKMPLASITLAFIRSSLWIFPVMLAIFLGKNTDVLEFTIVLWLLGSFVALVVGGGIIHKLTKGDIKPILDLKWIKDAIMISIVIFSGSLCLRAILGGDRFLINYIFNSETLAVYIFYASIVFAVVGLLETSVSAWHYPNMVKSIQLNKKEEYFCRLRKFLMESSISGAFILIVICLATPIMISKFLDPLYSRSFYAFYAMCFAVWLYTITMPFHYTLYGLHRDKSILIINFSGLVMMLVWAFSYMKQFGLIGAGIMFAISLTTISLMRVFLCTYIYISQYKSVPPTYTKSEQ
jgi:O-antigen/teichoic acid export membrane protein